jgi:hypothetical protein
MLWKIRSLYLEHASYLPIPLHAHEIFLKYFTACSKEFDGDLSTGYFVECGVRLSQCLTLQFKII